jgi:adenosylcobinamide-GDP ribazoletransferase
MRVPEMPQGMSGFGRQAAGVAKQALADAAGCLRFFSRLPVPRLPWEATLHALPDFATMPRMLPVAGAVLGGIAAAMFLLAEALGLGPWVAATLAIATLVVITGGLHEDGLADTADGFGGGATPERRLDVMRDSRIGAYGALALGLSLMLRIVLLGTLGGRVDTAAVAAALILTGALSRTAALLPMAMLPPARLSGASHAVGRPSELTLAVAWSIAGALGLVLVLATDLTAFGVALAFALAALAAWLLAGLSSRLIGGQTGDVVGAAQQAAEIAALLGLLIAARP